MAAIRTMQLGQFLDSVDGRGCRLGVITLIAVLVISLTITRSWLRLKHIPGPPMSALTNWVRRSWVVTGDAHRIHTALHRKYGTVVRIGPNVVMVSQPQAIDTIYGFKTRLEKSEFYDSIMPRIKGGKLPDIFATRDEGIHRQMRKPVARFFSVTNLTTFEPAMTSTMDRFLSRLNDTFANRHETFDLFRWIQFFMFDVLGEVTFSRDLGCIEKGEDVNGIMANIWSYFGKVAANTQMPWLDYLWRDNPLAPQSTKSNPLAEFAFARIMERVESSDIDKQNATHNDFLSCFLREQAKDSTLPQLFVPTWVNSNIIAGADTTSILASATVYYLLKNPSSLAKLREEIKEAASHGRLSRCATWKESRELPYLDACVKEATRLHPPFALPFERIVPKEGMQVDGFFIPGGTRVGINPWAMQREASVFGADPDAWRPERWLCSEANQQQMYNSFLTFGAGHRSCLGRHLAYFEIYKLVASLLQHFEVSYRVYLESSNRY
ncbi:unnamed protein product [Penicillium salamii]|uniref:Cytochrome P450 n=1 Tax=Penicillium salamii TaxID=1612424 RepID=A0A9W4J6Z1_9EURO|nr:unnamed protein product [Penicillium salamii]CAG8202960.1 unnamed protein product [Penicillium salamii]CAG8203747.1 unnamed protein product [Penicillium salamii]CAG8212586.1 unnamed protein product [Penicillium salamii]CAG8218478.1 unnamed protein product [Penicillium salamii]